MVDKHSIFAPIMYKFSRRPSSYAAETPADIRHDQKNMLLIITYPFRADDFWREKQMILYFKKWRKYSDFRLNFD